MIKYVLQNLPYRSETTETTENKLIIFANILL